MPAVAADLRRVALLLGASSLAGLLLGHTLAGIAVGLALLVAWQFRALWRMHRWLHGQGERPAQRIGLLGDVEIRLERLQRQARKRKKRLRKAARRYQQAFEANPDGVLILGRGARIEWLNAVAARTLGLRPAQDTGRPISNLLRDPRLAAWIEGEAGSEVFEMDAPTPAGQRLVLRAVPFGEARRLLLVRDITRLHTLEQMRRDFVANVSHELRTPLTVVMGDLEGLSDDPQLPESFRRPLSRMTQQAARMSHIVEDLLRLSRIESDPGGAVRNRLHVAEMLDTIVRDAALMSSGEHRLEVDGDPSVRLLGDHAEIYSAFSNLVFNAVQYTPGGGSVRVRWQATPTGARLQVQDTGVGIEAHHLPRLTERFYRVDKARSRELGGTGLGLAIVKHVLMRHDATLQVESEPGVGSTFTCDFPQERIERDASPGTPGGAEGPGLPAAV